MKARFPFYTLLLLQIGVVANASEYGAPSLTQTAVRAPVTARGYLEAVRDTMVIVRRGQSLSQVVMRHFLESDYATAHEMLDWTRYHNRLNSDVLISGQSLRIPLGPIGDDPVVPEQPALDGKAVRGIYLNVRRSGPGGALRLARGLREVGGNAVVFDIKDRDGMLTYDSSVEFARDVGATASPAIANPGDFVRQLHELGLYVIARLVCFQDKHLAASRFDLVPMTADGQAWSQHGSHNWVDPSSSVVQDYLFELMREAAALGVDELQLDYVRFPTVGNGALPAASEPPRADVITEFVRQAAIVSEEGVVQLSADVFGVAAWANAEDSERIGQDLQRLLPYLDIVSPMLYPSHFSAGFGKIVDPSRRPFDLVYRGCVRSRAAAVRHGVELRPWIQAFPWGVSDYSAMYVAEQMRAAREGGASGWLLWNPRNRYEEAMEAMRYFLPSPSTLPAAGSVLGDEQLEEVDATPVDGLPDSIGEPVGAFRYLVRMISPLL